MVARRWRGWARGPLKADAYVAHFDEKVRPQLEGIDGYVDATVDRVQHPGGLEEVVVVTRWESMDAIRAFTGDPVDVAVVEPEARVMLEEFDWQVRHSEVPDTDPEAGGS